MSPLACIRRAARRLARSEQGMAVPVVLTVVILGLGLGAAAIMSSISVQTGSSRDSDSKEALAAADAGMDIAVYRQNNTRTTPTDPCVVAGAGGTLTAGDAAADGWCPQFTGTVGESTYSYRVSPWAAIGAPATGIRRQMEVVAVGDHDDVGRRVAVVANARDGTGIFGGYGAVGRDRVTTAGSAEIGNGQIETGVASNGDVDNGGSLCGDVQTGVGREFITDSGNWCPGFDEGEGTVVLPPVDTSNVWDVNSNGRFFAQDSKSGSVTWDAATRTLSMDGNSTLTLGGTNYSFCKLDMGGGSQLIVAQGASVNIFFHSPEQCGLTGNPVSQIAMSGNPRLGPTSLNPGDMRLLFVGSETIATTATFDGNPSAGGSDFTIYAPNTDVHLQGNPTYRGAVAGKTLTVAGNAKLWGHPGALNSNIPIVILYERERFVECTGGTPQSPPDSYC